MIRVDRLKINIALQNLNFGGSILLQGYSVATVSLIYPYLQFDIERGAMRKPLLIKQGLKLNKFLLILSLLEFIIEGSLI